MDTFEFVVGKKTSASAGGRTPLSITCHVCKAKVPMSSLDQHMKVGGWAARRRGPCADPPTARQLPYTLPVMLRANAFAMP